MRNHDLQMMVTRTAKFQDERVSKFARTPIGVNVDG